MPTLPANQSDLEIFKELQKEIGWSNREVSQYLGKTSAKTVEAWRAGTYPVDPMAIKLMKFAASYARTMRAKRLGPNDLDHI